MNKASGGDGIPAELCRVLIEDEMVGRHHRLNRHEFEQALRVGDGQRSWHAAVQRVRHD